MRILLALLLPLALFAQAPPVAPSIEPAKREAILKLLKVTRAGEMSVQVMQEGIMAQKQAMPQVPEIFWTEFAKAMTADSFEALAIPIYDKHFALEELKAILAFYETPAGRAMLAKLPLVLHESMEAGKVLGGRIGEETARRLKAEGKI